MKKKKSKKETGDVSDTGSDEDTVKSYKPGEKISLVGADETEALAHGHIVDDEPEITADAAEEFGIAQTNVGWYKQIYIEAILNRCSDTTLFRDMVADEHFNKFPTTDDCRLGSLKRNQEGKGGIIVWHKHIRPRIMSAKKAPKRAQKPAPKPAPKPSPKTRAPRKEMASKKNT